MESLRDVKKSYGTGDREKGSCPLQFEYLEFGENRFSS